MALITESGEIKMGARAAWHWAFDPGVNSVDMREVLDSFGVKFSARGADGRIMAHVEKARIQQAINTLKFEKREAWAWGMLAYAPEGTENTNALRNILMVCAFRAIYTDKFNPYTSHEAGKLAFIAMSDAAIEARLGDGSRYKRKRAEMASLLRCDVDTYKREWSPKLYAMKDALKDLDAICLPPVFDVIALMADKAGSKWNFGAVEEFADAMRTPAAAV